MNIDFYVRIDRKGFILRDNKFPNDSEIRTYSGNYIAVYTNGQTSLVELITRNGTSLSVSLTLDKTKRFLIYSNSKSNIEVYFKIMNYSRNIPIIDSHRTRTKIFLREYKKLRKKILEEKEQRKKNDE